MTKWHWKLCGVRLCVYRYNVHLGMSYPQADTSFEEKSHSLVYTKTMEIKCPIRYKHKTMEVLYDRLLYLSCCLWWRDIMFPQCAHMVFFHHKQKDRYNNLLHKNIYFVKINHWNNKSELPEFRKKTVLLNILNSIVRPKSACQHILITLTYIWMLTNFLAIIGI